MEKYKDSINRLQIEEKYKNRIDSYYKPMVLGRLDAKRIERYEKMLEFIESVYKSIPTSRPLPENQEIINTFRYLSLDTNAPEYAKKDLYLLNFKDQKVEISRIKQVLQDFIEELPKIKRIELLLSHLVYDLVDVIDKSRLARIENLTTAASKVDKYKNESDRYYKSMILGELYANMLDANTLERYKEVLQLDANILEKSKKELKLIKSVYKLSKN
jgi:3',5'-cyclic AMP phosphodiesterase CpdA